MKTIIHKSDSRGKADFGWLNSRHTFSFGHYYDPNRMSFGTLRVLNDDVVAQGAGFPTHPHNNMEIISIPLKGALAHRDSTGTEQIINTGDVQIMSAGRGLTHSEYNASQTDEVNFLQIWVLPKEKDIEPRYDQKSFDASQRINKIQTVVAPNSEDALWINQDAYFSLLDLTSNTSLSYDLHNERNGVYVFVIDGDVTVANEELTKRDAVGIIEESSIDVSAQQDAKLLIIEVPYQ